jgi:hypothetical protein
MTENERLSRLSLADRLLIAAVDLAITRAPRALVSAVWETAERIAGNEVIEKGTIGVKFNKGCAGGGDAEEARTRGFAAPALAGCAFDER